MTRIRPALLVLSLLATACGGADEAATPAVPEVAVATAMAARGTFQPTVVALGRVIPREGHIARLAAPTATRVMAIRVSQGAAVRRGAILVELDTRPLEADRLGADAALVAADSAWRRAVRLQEAGIVARRDVEARAATLAQARAAAVGATRTAELAVLRSPLDGIVTQVSATLGASVDPGTVLVEVIDPTALDIDLDLGPADASRLRPGMIGLVTGAASAADTLGEATVRTIAGTVDSMGGAVRVRVRIVTPRRTLRGGEPVRAVLRLAPLADVVLVPVAALVPEGDAEVVFVVDDARVVHRRVVAVGDRNAVHAVVASGLQPGERVVTVGAYGMVDGARAVVDTTGAP